MRTLKLATRGSRLALAQAGLVKSSLEALGQTVELVEVTTRGDRDRTSPLVAIGGQGLFVREVERCLLDGTADLAVHSGIELLRRLLDGLYPAPPIAALMNFTITEVDSGRVVFRGLPGERHLNPLGGVHGGWAATIMDSALGCCVHSTLEPGEGYATVELKVNLTRPITPRTGLVTCTGTVVNRGRTIAVSEARLTDKDGKLLAFGTETCSIFPVEQMRTRR